MSDKLLELLKKQSRSSKEWSEAAFSADIGCDEEYLRVVLANAMMSMHDSIFNNEIQSLESRIKELERKNSDLKIELKAEREVVDFYANEENWEDCWIDGCVGSEDYFTSIKSDMGSRVGGHRARARQKDRREV